MSSSRRVRETATDVVGVVDQYIPGFVPTSRLCSQGVGRGNRQHQWTFKALISQWSPLLCSGELAVKSLAFQDPAFFLNLLMQTAVFKEFVPTQLTRQRRSSRDAFAARGYSARKGTRPEFQVLFLVNHRENDATRIRKSLIDSVEDGSEKGIIFAGCTGLKCAGQIFLLFTYAILYIAIIRS